MNSVQNLVLVMIPPTAAVVLFERKFQDKTKPLQRDLLGKSTFLSGLQKAAPLPRHISAHRSSIPLLPWEAADSSSYFQTGLCSSSTGTGGKKKPDHSAAARGPKVQ